MKFIMWLSTHADVAQRDLNLAAMVQLDDRFNSANCSSFFVSVAGTPVRWNDTISLKRATSIPPKEGESKTVIVRPDGCNVGGQVRVQVTATLLPTASEKAEGEDDDDEQSWFFVHTNGVPISVGTSVTALDDITGARSA